MNSFHFISLLFSLMALCFFSCSSNRDLPTEKKVDLNRYSGVWYEIARLPNRFEKNLKCVTAEYKLLGSDKIEVVNKGFSTTKNKFNSIKGKAWIPDAAEPGRLKVQFFWPFAGDYYIISLDENYMYALIGDPSRKYLWILSKTPQLDEAVYARLTENARSHGFKVEDMLKVKHDCAKPN